MTSLQKSDCMTLQTLTHESVQQLGLNQSYKPEPCLQVQWNRRCLKGVFYNCRLTGYNLVQQMKLSRPSNFIPNSKKNSATQFTEESNIHTWEAKCCIVKQDKWELPELVHTHTYADVFNYLSTLNVVNVILLQNCQVASNNFLVPLFRAIMLFLQDEGARWMDGQQILHALVCWERSEKTLRLTTLL